MKKSNHETAQRSLTLDVSAQDRQPVVRSIRRYRLACRQLFAVVGCAGAAGATIIDDEELSLRPDLPRAQRLLREVFGLEADDKAKAFAYPARRWFRADLYPTSLSFVWDSARRQVVARWNARDPEFTRASRGWLILQGARGVAEFQRVGIEFPQATARPKLGERSITLNWDTAIGPVELSLGRLDSGRWHRWTQVRYGAWSPGTLILNERDGQLRVTLSYEKPGSAEAPPDASRVLRVRLDESALVMAGPDGETTYDTIQMADALGMLGRLRLQRELWERRKSSAGNPRRAWGNKKAWRATVTHLGRVTLNRDRYTSDCNHAWSRRIATRALAWNCGLVDLVVPEQLGEHSWPWAQLKDFLRYKLGERGCSLTIGSTEKN